MGKRAAEGGRSSRRLHAEEDEDWCAEKPERRRVKAARKGCGTGAASGAGPKASHLQGHSASSCPFKEGVAYNAATKTFTASIQARGRYVYLGKFKAAADAARAHDAAALALLGRGAKLNLPAENYLSGDGQLRIGARLMRQLTLSAAVARTSQVWAAHRHIADTLPSARLATRGRHPDAQQGGQLPRELSRRLSSTGGPAPAAAALVAPALVSSPATSSTTEQHPAACGAAAAAAAVAASAAVAAAAADAAAAAQMPGSELHGPFNLRSGSGLQVPTVLLSHGLSSAGPWGPVDCSAPKQWPQLCSGGLAPVPPAGVLPAPLRPADSLPSQDSEALVEMSYRWRCDGYDASDACLAACDVDVDSLLPPEQQLLALLHP